MSFLTLADIAKASDIPEETLELPEWGGSIRVRGMSAKERLELAAIAQVEDKGKALNNIQRFALLHGIVEPEVTEEDLDMLVSKSSIPIDKIVGVFNRLSGTEDEDVLEARGNS